MAILEFPDHIAGDPYVLTRGEFLRFAGLLEDFQAFLQVLQRRAAGGRLPENGHNYEPEQQAFWAAIASFEAMRRFEPESYVCNSSLHMDAGSDVVRHSEMEWCYESTSGTFFKAIEWREYNDQDLIIEPAELLPEPMFTVTIPADRDQPLRSHYEALRRGGTYREF
jgi:hypothetical protein